MSFLPKEHGAYGQLAFPIVTALAACGATPAALLTTLAVVGGFLAHEPLVVLLGMRGPRMRRERGRAAMVWLAVVGVTAVVSGVAALAMTPMNSRWAFALPLVPLTLLVVAIATRQEKSWHAEIAVALTFSLAAVPICAAAGGSARTAFAVAVPFALTFIAGTLAVRVVIVRVRGGGDRRATAMTRRAALLVSVLGSGGLALAVAEAWLPSAPLIAAAPGLVLAFVVASFPPSPLRLRAIGWTLVAASTFAALVIISMEHSS